MANSKTIDVMRYALQQYRYTESPAGSNRTKFGREFGLNGQPWCFIFEWACGEQAKGDNPFPHNANAAYGQDEIVSKKGGKWVMKKTASNTVKRAGLKNAKFGDCVDFDFGKNNMYRQHTGLVVGVAGNNYLVIEGNTSIGTSGSQSNGGAVALRVRHYTQVCSNARPKYTESKFYKPSGAFTGTFPELPKSGSIEYGDEGKQVGRLQEALKWANGYALASDKKFGSKTFAEVVIFQVANGLVPDGEFGRKTLAKMKAISDGLKKASQDSVEGTSQPVSEAKPTKPTNTSTSDKKPVETASAKHPELYVPKKGDKCYDLSAWQGSISRSWFEAIKQKGIKCVILRSSYTSGASFVLNEDKYFDNNIRNAIKAGMHIGIYHFSQAKSEAEAKKEAEFCLKTIKPYIGSIDLPVAFDWESYKRLTASFMKKNGRTANGKIVDAFCNVVKKAGYEPMVYASLVVFNNYLPTTIYKKLKIWVAQYYKTCQYKHDYYMWQYTSNNGKLDENYFGSQDTKKKVVSTKTSAEKIMAKATEYAYPKGTAKSKYEVKTGKPKAAYTKALDKIFPRHKAWKKEIRNGASCAVFVSTSVRASGVDTKFLCDDPPKIIDYMRKSSKYVKQNTGKNPLPLSKMKPGDIIAYEKPGANGGGHILFYKGDGYIEEANYGRCYPHTSKMPKAYLNEKYINNTYKRFVVYRAK